MVLKLTNEQKDSSQIALLTLKDLFIEIGESFVFESIGGSDNRRFHISYENNSLLIFYNEQGLFKGCSASLGDTFFYFSDYIYFHNLEDKYETIVDTRCINVENCIEDIKTFISGEVLSKNYLRRGGVIVDGSNFGEVIDLKLVKFLKSLGYDKTSNGKEEGGEYHFSKNEYKLIVKNSTRLDSGYVLFGKNDEIKNYSEYLKKIDKNDLEIDKYVSHWGAGFYAGNYYKVCSIIKNTISNIEKTL